VISFHGVGLSVSEEMKYEDITAHTENIDEACSVYCLSIYGHGQFLHFVDALAIIYWQK
jgi:hypothetical protein